MDLNVSTGCLGIRADLVCFVHELLSMGQRFGVGDFYLDIHSQAKAVWAVMS